MKLHFDENVDEDAAFGLRARGIDVTITSEEGLRGVPDEEQIAFAVRGGRILVSHDPDVLRLHAQAIGHLGIAFCRMGKYDVGALVRRLLAFTYDVTEDEMRNKVEYL